ncbi:hypothetical protein BIU82_07280 [Arthrobacter sp. SW1]|nr:hypothetical protein BIU82_07280 [Arthrobacter sp. SW1]
MYRVAVIEMSCGFFQVRHQLNRVAMFLVDPVIKLTIFRQSIQASVKGVEGSLAFGNEFAVEQDVQDFRCIGSVQLLHTKQVR